MFRCLIGGVQQISRRTKADQTAGRQVFAGGPVGTAMKGKAQRQQTYLEASWLEPIELGQVLQN